MQGRVGLSIALPGMIFALFGCNAQLSPEAKRLLESGTASCSAGDNQQAIRDMDAFLAQAGKSRQADQAFYIRGLARYNLADSAGAKTDFQEALKRTEDPQIRAKASLMLGHLAYDSGDMALAENMYRQVLSDLDENDQPSGDAHFRLGGVLQRQGRWREADVEFSRVIYFFSGSELARRAKQRLHCSAWAIQAGAYARYDNAAAALRRMTKAKLPARIQSIMRDQQLRFVIRIGPYPTFEQAEDVLPNVKRLQSDAFIVPTE